ncbi:MAG: SCP2 sterol-binding domain-containing protein [Gammaproteobacteria bacterium]|nr:SCP2 sterol-binding domain-containing protein [Gammaproteobacteria bacterium]
MLRPLGLLPGPLTRQGFVTCCNQLFAEALAAGELAFLEQRVLCIAVEDAGIELALSLKGVQLQGVPAGQPVDVTIRGTTYDLLLLMSRREDADTLFFQRRLRLEGETELGLHLKNFLDAWEPPASVRLIQQMAATGLSWAERFTGDKPLPSPTRGDPTNSHRKAPLA